ncbi:MAG: glucuronate isomerase [Pseudomonadota bacterium]
MQTGLLHEDRLFPSDPDQRTIARELYADIRDLPIISPHGHTDPSWFALNEPFPNPTELLIAPDHYVFRMLYSQGVSLDALGVPRADGSRPDTDPREAWRTLASHYHLLRGTPSRMWLDHVFSEVFGLSERLNTSTADHYYDTIDTALKTEDFRPRALFDRFNIELLSTTEGATDSLSHHEAIQASDWDGRVISAYRPDAVNDAEHEDFQTALDTFGELTGEDTRSWKGYLNAHRKRREDFKAVGTTSSDHGHISARTADLDASDAQTLFEWVTSGKASAEDADLFRAQMLTEMARMSLDDGLVMQIHPGARRNHNDPLFHSHGRDKGADIPGPTGYVDELKPLLNRFGNDPRLTLIIFTLDETSYSRELAPLAGHYPALRLGPAWWFHDSPEGMRRFREQTTETAGFYNTVGFNDDTRAFLSIPARHDVARRVDCAFLARLVAEHRLPLDEAHEVARALAYDLVKAAYKV